MFTFQLKEMMRQKGIKTPYRHLLRMGIAQTRAKKYLAGTQTHISLADLYKFCIFFNCTPKELLKIKLPLGDTILQNTPLEDWIATPDLNLIDHFMEMTPEEMEQMRSFYKTMKAGESAASEGLSAGE